MKSPTPDKVLSPEDLLTLLFGPAAAEIPVSNGPHEHRITPIGPARYSEDCDCPPGVCLGEGMATGVAGETFAPSEVGISDVIDPDAAESERLYAEDRALAAGLVHAAAQFGEAFAVISRIADRVIPE